MNSVQERLQKLRIPLDKWSVREQLCLASAVACSGDQNWMSVSRSLKIICGNGRPNDWFSQKYCAAQYGKLLENVETPKRKKRTATERDSTNSLDTPGESIVKTLTQERIVELKKQIDDEEKEYQKLREEINLIQNTDLEEEKLLEMWNEIEQEKLEKEKEQLQYDQWLREREEKKLEMERAWRPSAIPNLNSMSPTSNSNSSNSPSRNSPLHQSSTNSSMPGIKSQVQISSNINPMGVKIKQEELDLNLDENTSSSSTSFKQGTSPLLTSLLKSPSSNNQHPSSSSSASLNSVQQSQIQIQQQNLSPSAPLSSPSASSSSSARVLAPTITNLLTGQPQNPNLNQIPVQNQQGFQQNHFQFLPNSHQPPLILVQPQQTLLHQHQSPSQAAPTLSKLLDRTKQGNQQSTSQIQVKLEQQQDELQIKREMLEAAEDHVNIENEEQLMEVFKELMPGDLNDLNDIMSNSELLEEGSILENVELMTGDSKDDTEEEPQLEEKIPNEEDHNEFIQNPEEVKEVVQEPIQEVDESVIEPDTTTTEEQSIENPPQEIEQTTIILDDDKEEEENQTEEEINETVQSDAQEESIVAKEESTFPAEEESKEEDSRNESRDLATIEEESEVLAAPEAVEEEKEEPAKKIEERKISTDNEDQFEDAKSTLDDSGNLEQETEQKEESLAKEIEAKPEPIPIDTDYDSPLEVKKKDYSKKREEPKKTDDSGEETRSINLRKRLTDRDRSESPLVTDDDTSDMPRTRRRYSSTPVIDSVPSSPASGDDRDYKNWKKSVLIAYNRFSTLYFKYSAILVQQVPEEFKNVILKPMDMQVIKKNIETGVTRTTTEFQRDILLMVQNAIMMNTRKDKDWLNLFKEMMIEVDYWRKETEKNLNQSSNGSSSSKKDLSRKRKKVI